MVPSLCSSFLWNHAKQSISIEEIKASTNINVHRNATTQVNGTVELWYTLRIPCSYNTYRNLIHGTHPKIERQTHQRISTKVETSDRNVRETKYIEQTKQKRTYAQCAGRVPRDMDAARWYDRSHVNRIDQPQDGQGKYSAAV